MSFNEKVVNALSKFFTSFDESKKTPQESSDNNIDFSFNQNSEQSSMSEMANDYLHSKDEIVEQMHYNQQQFSFSANSLDAQSKMMTSILQSNIPESLKNEIFPLYEDLVNSTSEDAKNVINAQIEEAYLNAEANGVDLSEFESTKIDIQMLALKANYNSHISHLYAQLSDVESSDAKYSINAKIEELQSKQNAEQNNLFVQYNIQQYNLPENQKQQLSSLYADFANTTDENSQKDVKLKIYDFCSANGINYNGQMISELNHIATRAKMNEEMANLYAVIGDVSPSNVKVQDKLWAKLGQVRTSYDMQLYNYEQNILFEQMNLPVSVQDEIGSLCANLKDACSDDVRNSISAQINQKLSSSGVDMNSNEVWNLKFTMLDYSKKSDLEPLYAKLVKASTDSEKAQINNQINTIVSKYQPMFEDLWRKK